MNSAEKSKIWKDQFEVALADPEFNQTQRDFITQLLFTVVPRLFEVGSDEYKKFNLSEPRLRIRAIELFGRDDAYKLIANISTRVAVTDKNTTPYPPASGGCDCSRQSDWCGNANPYGCVREGCTTGSGCGTFWSYTCNGDCF